MNYLAIYCKNCNRHFMSTSIKNFKCSYCGKHNGTILENKTDSRLITEYIKQANIKR